MTLSQVVPPSAAAAPPAKAATAAAAAPGAYVAVTPSRLVDTRNGTGTGKAQIKAGGTLVLQVGGRAGIPATGVGAVAVNINVVNSTASGRLIVWADGTTRPDISSVNFVAAVAATSLVVTRISSAGKFAVFNSAARPIDLIVDVSGYWVGGTVTAAGGFVPVTPARSLDTRSGLGASRSTDGWGGQWAQLSWQVSGRTGVPAGATAVVMSVTATNVKASGTLVPIEDGYFNPGLPTWFTGFEYDVTQVVGMAPTRNMPTTNLFVVPLSEAGKAKLNSQVLDGEPDVDHAFDVLGDVLGYIKAGQAVVPGMHQTLPIGRIGEVTVSSRSTNVLKTPVPAGATALLQVTVSAAAGGGMVAYQAGTTMPATRNISFNAGQRVSNAIAVKTSAGSEITLQNLSSGALTVTIELAGYQLAAAPPPAGDVVWIAGMNFAGVLGQGYTSGQSETVHPVPIPLKGVVSVASYFGTALAVTSDGSLWSWGNDDNDYTVDGGGMLGNGPLGSQSRPAVVPGLHGVSSAGIIGEIAWALQSDGTVWRWGYYPAGSLQSPQLVSGLSDIVTVNGDQAVRRDGSVWQIAFANVSQDPPGYCPPAGCWVGVPVPS